MCGIFGAITEKGLDDSLILRIKSVLRHRGPDSHGNIQCPVLPSRRLDLVHVRLSIIDLSLQANQPMSSADENLWIIYNGEVFNYRELREELKQKGYHFRSRSDTEVVLASYRQWGKDCVKHFNGDWAFCIYDKRNNHLFLSRDRLGVKPLYYYYDGQRFAFSSEPQGLFTLSFIEKKWNLDLVAAFILLGVSDFSKSTMYGNIKQLEPACNLIFDFSSGTIDIKKYWNPPCNMDDTKYNIDDEKKYKNGIRQLLEDSVRLRLRADVKVGTCLSGGIDSSSIVMIVNKMLIAGGHGTESIGQLQKTFTASYRKEDVDEEKWARIVTGVSNVDAKFVYPQAQEFKGDLAGLFATHDELFGSTSIYAQYRVMRLASEHVRVVLDGQGADELFAGYFPYKTFTLSGVHLNLKCLMIFLLRKIYHLLSRKNRKRAFLISHRKSMDFLYSVIEAQRNLDFMMNIFEEKTVPNLNNSLLLAETKYSLRQLLRYEDRNSMRFSLEARVPFTDYRLVEYVFGIPVCYKIHNGWTKYILRKAVEDILPPQIAWRKDKIGFQTPETKWLQSTDDFSCFLKRLGVKNYTGSSFWWRLFNFVKLTAE